MILVKVEEARHTDREVNQRRQINHYVRYVQRQQLVVEFALILLNCGANFELLVQIPQTQSGRGDAVHFGDGDQNDGERSCVKAVVVVSEHVPIVDLQGDKQANQRHEATEYHEDRHDVKQVQVEALVAEALN